MTTPASEPFTSGAVLSLYRTPRIVACYIYYVIMKHVDDQPRGDNMAGSVALGANTIDMSKRV
jgi:hypothetical protein